MIQSHFLYPNGEHSSVAWVNLNSLSRFWVEMVTMVLINIIQFYYWMKNEQLFASLLKSVGFIRLYTSNHTRHLIDYIGLLYDVSGLHIFVHFKFERSLIVFEVMSSNYYNVVIIIMSKLYTICCKVLQIFIKTIICLNKTKRFGMTNVVQRNIHKPNLVEWHFTRNFSFCLLYYA